MSSWDASVSSCGPSFSHDVDCGDSVGEFGAGSADSTTPLLASSDGEADYSIVSSVVNPSSADECELDGPLGAPLDDALRMGLGSTSLASASKATPADESAEPLHPIGKIGPITGDEYDKKYGIVLSQNLPANAKITDNGPTFAENMGVVLDATAMVGTAYAGLIAAPTIALASLGTVPELAWLAPSHALHTQAVQLSKVALTSIFADSAFDYGNAVNDMLDHKSSIRSSPGDFANLIVGFNKAVPINIGGVQFRGLSVAGFVSNSSAFDGVPDKDGNTIYNDAVWAAVGFKPDKDSVFAGVFNGMGKLPTGVYLRGVGLTPKFSIDGTAKATYIDINPFSDDFLKHYDMIDMYLYNSAAPKVSSNINYSVGYYKRFESNQRERLSDEFLDLGNAVIKPAK